MNIIFISNQLGLRGTEISLYDMAHYCETILGHTSYISAPVNSEMSAYYKFKDRFEDRVFLYSDFNELEQYCKEENISHSYIIKSGEYDGKVINGVKNFIHVVFNGSTPHGECYLAVSEWLGEKYHIDYLPHILSLPKIEEDFRSYLNIPKEAIVFGRHGGNDSFDIPYMNNVISTILHNRKEAYFLFMNTDGITINDERVKLIEATTDVETKTAFINTCDYMLHGRQMGESFGIAVCEFLHQNKPVITNIECRDMHHIKLMQDEGYYYGNENELFSILMYIQKNTKNVSHLVSKFKPEIVINKFKEVFLDR